MSSQFGNFLKISTWGESHGKSVGVVIDGFPPNIPITIEEVQKELDKRKPGQSNIVTQRAEFDVVQILSGLFEGKTTGTPIALMVLNKDHKSNDYNNLKDLFRPSHADYTYQVKYGIRDHRGGGRSSARETIGRVAAGAFVKKWLKSFHNIDCIGFVSQIGNIKANINPLNITQNEVESNIVRCPHPKHEKMISEILKVRKDGDSIGGVIQFIIKNVPKGLGEPVFDRVEANLAKACLSIPATKGFEIGSGFYGSTLKGSEHNDLFEVNKQNKITTKTNNSGGVQGGITNGMPIICKVAFKPTATILKPQKTININGDSEMIQIKGRHDPCVLPRAVVIIEAMASLVIMDLLLEFQSKITT